MRAADPRLVDEIYGEALELSREERVAHIEKRCGEDAELRAKVISLVAASESGAELDSRFGDIRDRLLRTVLGDELNDAEEAEDLAGLRVGAWRLEKRLARGGLATVYVARRDDGEYEQRVAFKVLRRGLDTDDLVARFRAERQILSALDHPAIAGILDGGALPDGRPYLVLEFVDGAAITEYCARQAVSVRGRVRLLLDVLRALHHAHRHLVVHRDVKPSNILVSADGHVQLLDFGIAKLLEPGAVPGASTLTRTGVSLQTPGYCSPEQHAGQPVTTASDIYQAGAVLYELLTGRRPRSVSDDGDYVQPAPPSHALKGMPGQDVVRGDLDAIVAKAMHADPARRYASADEMEADLKRYLDGRPVIARPDTWRYRLAKFSKRRPWALPVAIAVLVAIAGYIVTLTVYTERLSIEQRRASAAQAFMVDLLSSPDPFRPADPELGRDITIVEALNLGIDRLESDLPDDPELRASVLSSVASVYASLDQHDKAISLREEALRLERLSYGEPSGPVLASMQLLAGQYLATGDYDRAVDYSEGQLASARQLYADDDPALGVAEATAAEVAYAVGNFEEAEALYGPAIDRMRPAAPEFADTLIPAFAELSAILQFDETERAFALLDEAGELAERLYGPDSLPMAQVRARRAANYSSLAQYAEAEREFRAAIPIYEASIGRNHSATLLTLNNLAVVFVQTGQNERAEEIYRELLGRYLDKYGEAHTLVADTYQNLATAMTRLGRYEESIPLHRKAYEIYKAVLPQDQPRVAYPLISMAYAEVNHAAYADAEVTARQALETLERTAADTYLIGIARCLVGRALEGQGRVAEGGELLDRSRTLLAGSLTPEPYRRICRLPDD